MTGYNTFSWHPASHVYAAGTEVVQASQEVGDFQAILAEPSGTALAQLEQAIKAETPFCVHQGQSSGCHTLPKGYFLTLTGGTSGQPKVIRRTQASWIASFVQNANTFEYTPNDSLAVVGTLNHSLSLYGVIEAIHMGLDAHVLDMFTFAQQRARIAEHAISILYLTPSQLRLLCAGHETSPLPSVRLILCGGGDLNKATRRAAQTLFPNAQVRAFYGAAETSFITLADDQTPDGSVGKPFCKVDLKLDQNGEVWVKSPYLFDRYEMGSAPDTRWHDGYLTVGELGTLDAAGNLWLKGRKTRMLTIADQNVFPEEIEGQIKTIANVIDCAVVSLPDTLRGQRLVAVLQGPQDSGLAQIVRQTCVERFGPMIAPRAVAFRDHFPRLPSGKIDLATLTSWVEMQV